MGSEKGRQREKDREGERTPPCISAFTKEEKYVLVIWKTSPYTEHGTELGHVTASLQSRLREHESVAGSFNSDD